jgi:hypothetical protein
MNVEMQEKFLATLLKISPDEALPVFLNELITRINVIQGCAAGIEVDIRLPESGLTPQLHNSIHTDAQEVRRVCQDLVAIVTAYSNYDEVQQTKR